MSAISVFAIMERFHLEHEYFYDLTLFEDEKKGLKRNFRPFI